jgi:alpha-N-arabinofuranosidase
MGNILKIDIEATPKVYDRKIFGGFLEHFHRQIYGGIFDPGNPLSNEQGFREDVIEAVKELKIPIVRWPGGCFVSAYHWKKGVGSERIPSYDKAWHVEEPNTFGTDEFVEWCKLADCEPFICTNAGTGTEEEMSDWVEYCNLPYQGEHAKQRIENGYDKSHNVKYWSIGNENWGGHEMGAKTADRWKYFVRESAKLMKNVDPSIKLFAAALADEKWTLPLLQTAGMLLNYVSIHGYWDPLWLNNNPSNFKKCMLRTLEPEATIRNTIEILKKVGLADKVKIAFDEWNLRGWHHPGFGNPNDQHTHISERDKNDINSTYTMADALFTACFLNSCLRNSEYVKIACIAPLVNARGPIYTHPKGIVKRTTYHVLHMYSHLLQPFVIDSVLTCKEMLSKLNENPYLDAVVTSNEEKSEFAIPVVNKHAEMEIKLEFSKFDTLKQDMITSYVLNGNGTDDYNDITFPNRVIPHKKSFQMEGDIVKLSPHSLSIIKF